MPNDNLPSIVSVLHQIVDSSEANDETKNRLLSKLTEGRFNTLTQDEAIEVLTIMDQIQAKIEKDILATNDPDQIQELTVMKTFIDEMLFDAEAQALQEIAGDQVNLGEEVQSSPKKYSPQYLLDRLAGLSE